MPVDIKNVTGSNQDHPNGNEKSDYKFEKNKKINVLNPKVLNVNDFLKIKLTNKIVNKKLEKMKNLEIKLCI